MARSGERERGRWPQDFDELMIGGVLINAVASQESFIDPSNMPGLRNHMNMSDHFAEQK